MIIISLLFTLIVPGGSATAQYNNHLRVSEDSMLSLHQANQTFIPAKKYYSYNRRLVNVISDNSGNIAYTYYSGTSGLFLNDSILVDSLRDFSFGYASRNWLVPMSFSGYLALGNSDGGLIEVRILEERSRRIKVFTPKVAA